MTTSGNNSVQAAPGFWKPKHALIGLGVVGLIVFAMVKGCSGDPEDVSNQTGTENGLQQPAMASQMPSGQPAYYMQPQSQPQSQPQQVPVYSQQPPVYQQPQQQVYQQPPVYQQQQPVYGQPVPQQQQPGLGYPGAPPVAVQQPQQPVGDANNPWSSRTQGYGQLPTYGGTSRPSQWGQPVRPPPVYASPPAVNQYRPLDEDKQQHSQPTVVYTVPVWPSSAPYERPAGSTYGAAGAGVPYGTGYPGYYGAPGPSYGAGYPGYGYPGRW